MDKIKVLMIAPIVFPISNSLKYAGTERVIASLTEEFNKNKDLGIDLTLAASGDSDIDNTDLIFVYSESLWLLDNFERKTIDPKQALEEHYSYCLDYAIKNKIDIIHDNVGIIGSISYNKIKDDFNIPIVVTMHNDVDDLQRFISWKRLQMDKRPIFFISISKSQKKKFEEKTGLRIFDYVYNGIQVDKYPFVKEKQDYLFWIGRISYKKGTDLAIKIAKNVKKPLIIAGEVHTPDMEFYEKEIKSNITKLIGGKNKKEKDYNKKDLIEKLQKNESIVNSEDIFFIGPVNDWEKGILNSRAYSLLVLNRWEEPFGLVMPEAMVTGTPVIGTQRGSIPEIIIDKKTGFIVPIEWIDEESLSLKEDKLIEDTKKALDNINQINPEDCFKHVKQNFSSLKMAQKYGEIYKKILKIKINNGKIENI